LTAGALRRIVQHRLAHQRVLNTNSIKGEEETC
jgi:hypothetical protein